MAPDTIVLITVVPVDLLSVEFISGFTRVYIYITKNPKEAVTGARPPQTGPLILGHPLKKMYP